MKPEPNINALKYTSLIKDKHPWSLNKDEKTIIEKALKPYSKGGNFLFEAQPRCPFCNSILPNLIKDKIYYYEIGEVINADETDIWI